MRRRLACGANRWPSRDVDVPFRFLARLTNHRRFESWKSASVIGWFAVSRICRYAIVGCRRGCRRGCRTGCRSGCRIRRRGSRWFVPGGNFLPLQNFLEQSGRFGWLDLVCHHWLRVTVDSLLYPLLKKNLFFYFSMSSFTPFPFFLFFSFFTFRKRRK